MRILGPPDRSLIAGLHSFVVGGSLKSEYPSVALRAVSSYQIAFKELETI